MGRTPAGSPPLFIAWGDDDHAVTRRTKQVFEDWRREAPDADCEVIDGTAANAEEALRVLGRLREALRTLPFFGGSKSIWLRSCNFTGEGRVSEAQSVQASLADLGRELAAFDWRNVRLAVSTGKIDRRRAFYKTLDTLADSGGARIEHFPALSPDDRDWREKAESIAAAEFRALAKRPSGEALSSFVEQVGPNSRLLASEAAKLATYVGDRQDIALADVEAVVTRGRHARAFALADALGDRDLPRALRCLQDELWAMQSDRQRSEIGLLYGLITKIRTLILVREMFAEGLLRKSSDYRSFCAQLKTLSVEGLPADRRYNPLEINSYVLFRAAQQCARFTPGELVLAMEELLQCNRRLVGSDLDGALVLQMAITRIASPATPPSPNPVTAKAR
ncbi:MAG: DNA polymerase III subunit delta [Verrucomicrobiae bacterium]|nr:DNA polymerase III subunit delta [Verrucomicrobiae bacterium]